MLRRVRLELMRLFMLLVLGSVLAGCLAGGPDHPRIPVEPVVLGVQSGWRETRFSTGCEPGPFTEPPPPLDDLSAGSGPLSAGVEIADPVRVRVDLVAHGQRAPLLGAGFNLEHGLWSCSAFHPVLDRDLLGPFR